MMVEEGIYDELSRCCAIALRKLIRSSSLNRIQQMSIEQYRTAYEELLQKYLDLLEASQNIG
jgi:predicted metal-binding transcription factor (methanogenesis marker protein 9)